MPLFQKTVLKEFVARQNQEHIQEAYTKFQAHFGNADIQKNITAAKEEQYQEGFLKDLFVDILGYTLNPQPNFNLTTEQKNETDSKKADAAILAPKSPNAEAPQPPKGEFDVLEKTPPSGIRGLSLVIGIIELKSVKTTLLQSIEYQAFGYKNHHQNCRYVITSNFTKLRFYLDNAIEFEEFDLFALTLPQFAVLYTLLHCKNLLAELPIKLKQQSIEREEELTLSFYNDYENFKDVLFLDISNKNRHIDKFTLFQKTQKLLDRIVFICFAEDKGLLPSNLIKKIVTEWENLRDYNEYKPLFAIFLKHFGYINNGFKNKLYDIFGYNGGLFAEDEILSQLQITDQLLMNQCSYLSRYDFDSDIDVNVLGHIFEHSLNQLDAKRKELIEKAQKIELGEKPKENGKRKIDGIFYTPAYITAYMVQETVGKLCEEKKTELGLINTQIDFENEEAKETQSTKLQSYETWLTTIRVLDPACGSGAFLNQVLTFFIAEYAWLESAKNALLPPKIEEKIEKIVDKITQEKVDIFSAPTQIPVPIEVKIVKEEKNIIHQILENNIFGVDLNEESVEITKLSLWLKTASMRQKLNNLTDNIKCGNSLIDDKAISEKAFEWGKEFPKAAQGFTVIVGNPPYVSANNMNFQQRQYFNNSETYKTLAGKWDLFVPFIERGLSLLQDNGVLSFIVPYGLLNQPFATNLRKHILDNFSLHSIVDLHTVKVFAEATVPTCIPIIRKTKNLYTSIDIIYHTKENDKVTFVANHQIEIEKYLHTENYMFRTEKLDQSFSFLEKIKAKGTELGELFYVSTGAEIHGKESRTETELTSGHSKFDVLHEKMADGFKPYIEGAAIPKSRSTGRYCFPDIDYYLDYDNNFDRMRSPKFKELFENPKIMVRRSAGLLGILATYDERKLYCTEKCILIIDKNNIPETHKKFQVTNLVSLKYVLAIINSKLMNFYYTSVYGGFIDVYPNYLKSLPIFAEISPEIEQIIVDKVDKLLLAHQNLSKLNKTFLKVLKANFGLEKANEKLTNWYEMEWGNFTKEMKKLKSEITGRKEFEWIEIFEEKKSEAQNYLNQIQTLDNQIDKMIYALYDLSEEEIKIVEM